MTHMMSVRSSKRGSVTYGKKHGVWHVWGKEGRALLVSITMARVQIAPHPSTAVHGLAGGSAEVDNAGGGGLNEVRGV